MKRFKNLPGLNLRLKFVLPISAILMLGMGIIGGLLIQRQSDGFQRELESVGETIITQLAFNAESGVLFESSYELETLLGTLRRFSAVEYCVISNVDDQNLSSLGIKPEGGETLAGIIETGHKQLDLSSGYITDSEGRSLFILIAPISTEKKVRARETLGLTGSTGQAADAKTVLETIGWVELGMSDESVQEATHEATVAAIMLTLLLVVLTIIIVTFIVGAITKPITELVEATYQISRGDFSKVIQIDRQDELGQLARTFNHMTGSLKESRTAIEEYNRTLEEKIIERTKQLEDAQAQLIQSEKMGAIGQLAAGVAHELNNPLGGILGYAQFTIEKLSKNVPEKTEAKEIESYLRYVRDIEVQARRCKAIVQNLLRFSRTSRTMDFEEVDINAAIRETLTFVEHQLRISQIELVVDLVDELPSIQGNTGQLQQVFTNLIINAMHASEPGSSISVCTRFSPSLGEFGGAVEVTVADTGTGIAQENLKKIFEPFFTTKDVGKGTGLGLSVSYGIVNEHGGEITVKSEPGQGCSFTIVLPVQKKETTADIGTKTGREQHS